VRRNARNKPPRPQLLLARRVAASKVPAQIAGCATGARAGVMNATILAVVGVLDAAKVQRSLGG
jgi:hypothetical protein